MDTYVEFLNSEKQEHPVLQGAMKGALIEEEDVEWSWGPQLKKEEWEGEFFQTLAERIGMNSTERVMHSRNHR